MATSATACTVLDAPVSCFPNAFATDGSTHRTVAELLDDIQNGVHQMPVESLRQSLADGRRDMYDSQKRGLSCATPAGTFTERGIEGFEEPSELAPLDLDFNEKRPELLPEAQALRDRLANDPIVAAVFVSPSGAGVKPWIRIPPVADDTEYKQIFADVAKYLRTTYCNVATDGDASDISRLCFLSWDPGCYRNPDALPFPGYREARLLHALAQMLWKMRNGERDATRNRVAHTLGGHIAGGLLEDTYVLAYFEPIVRVTTQHPDKQWRKFQKQLERGKKRPIKDTRLIVQRAQAHADRHQNGQHAPLPFSDTSNAQRLVTLYGDNLRHCDLWKKWLMYTGTHWVLDTTSRALHAARETAKVLAKEAADTKAHVAELSGEGFTEHQKQRKEQADALYKHAKISLNTPRLEAMLKAARPDLAITPEALCANPWLMNCLNGTIDLRTGTLHAHQRNDYLMHCLPVAYDPKADCHRWEEFLREIFSGNNALIDFLWRAVGYSLTGDVREQLLFILHGGGQNGKSTFLNCLLGLLGNQLAMKASGELLLASRDDRHPTERADLFHKRFVCCIETQEGRRLNEPFVKEATGGDPIRARRMREDFWDFWPTHKIWLATNHKPDIRGVDHAIWRRLRLIPFNVTFENDRRDTTLPDQLRSEWPGILAWGVRGCQAWLKDGLETPSTIIDATKLYRAEMDVLRNFLDDCCTILPEASVKRSALRETYVQWCKQTGEEALNDRAFGERLIQRGFERFTNNGTWYRGIGLQASNPEIGKKRHDLE